MHLFETFTELHYSQPNTINLVLDTGFDTFTELHYSQPPAP